MKKFTLGVGVVVIILALALVGAFLGGAILLGLNWLVVLAFPTVPMLKYFQWCIISFVVAMIKAFFFSSSKD